MKLLYITILLLLSTLIITVGQTHETDSLKRILAQTGADTTRVLLLVHLANTYRFSNPDSAKIIVQKALQLSRRLDFTSGEVRALNALGAILYIQGEYPKALEIKFEALRISKNSHDPEEATSLAYIGSIYLQLGEYRQALRYFRQALEIKKRRQSITITTLSNIGDAYEKMNQLDSAYFYQLQASALLKDLPRSTMHSLVITRLGVIQARLGNPAGALRYYHDALENAHLTGDLLNQGRVQQRIAELYHQSQQMDSSLAYARLAFTTCEQVSNKLWQLQASNLLAKLYQEHNKLDSAFYYLQVSAVIKDSLFGPEKFQRLQLLTSVEKQRQQEILQAQAAFEEKIRLYALAAASGVFLLLAVILYRNNRQKQKANALLLNQKEEIDKQRDKAEKALENLKSAQTQLIQSEKMASLGELTAGIAHEIQNPLNFVNNFSEVSLELCQELQQELQSLRIPPADKENLSEITSNLSHNQEKINQHGKRADAIVKSMLQHSRASSGEKQLTDINALADEYLRLSYHGLRAKEKDFNVNLLTDFDSSLGKVETIPQELGRVLINLYNNAFYATQQKKNQLNGQYQPEVKVITCQQNGRVEIKIRDNGTGMPESIKNKIFQPFFTTKPTGQGTGLGLSLSYDIITKGHGGEMKVETQEGEFSEFSIQLPNTIN